MVISVKNRKRKLSTGNDEVPPAKITKQTDGEEDEAPAVMEEIEGAEIEQRDDDEMETADTTLELPEEEFESIPVEKEMKFTRDFKMSEFRKKLKGDNFITELRHFLYLATDKPRIVTKYIEKRGKPLELVEALERVDRTNLVHVSYLCHALQLVLMEILTNEKTLTAFAISSCRYFLRNHNQLLERLIRSSKRAHRNIALKLSTAMVCLEPQLGRQLLTSFDVISSKKSMEGLLSHSRADVDNEETTRKCFVHFVLSYFVDGNILLIRNILDKYEVLYLLMAGLVQDDHVTVAVVLSTLKKYVLEFLLVSKTKKIYVFDLDMIKQLLKLYDWKGPGFIRCIKADAKSKYVVNADEKKSVIESLNEFLILLLSNRKYGLAFDAMRNFKQKRNAIQHKTLSILMQPWNDPYKIELVLNVLHACPELAKGMLKHCGCIMVGRSNQNVYKILAFLEKIIIELNPSIMRSGIDYINLTEFTYWIKEICLSTEVLLAINKNDLLKSRDVSIRLITTRFLYATFRQYCNYMNAIIAREKFNGNDLKKFRFDMLDHLFVNFPTVENIFLSLYISIQDNTTDILQHLDSTFDLVILIYESHRTFADTTTTITNYLTMLKPIYESEAGGDPETRVRLELKAIKLILLLNPKALEPNNKLFRDVIDSFVNAFVLGSEQSKLDAGNLLRKLFSNTKMFDNGILEIDIWLEALRHVEIDAVNEMKKIFTNSFRKLAQSGHKSERMEGYRGEDYSGGCNLKALFRDIENDVSVQGHMEIPELSKIYTNCLNEKIVSPKNSKYLELVALLLFHYIPAPRAIANSYSKHFTTFYKYMLTWLDKQKSGKLKDETIPYFNEMYASIVGGESKFEEIFKGTESFSIDGKDIQLDRILKGERFVMILIYQICFIVSQLTQHLNFETIRCNSASYYLIKFLEILNSLKGSETEIISTDISSEEEKPLHSIELALKYIYCNHLPLLQSFNIFGQGNSDENFLKFMCEITATVKKFELSQLETFTVHYRTKIVNQIVAVTSETVRKGTMPNSDMIIKVLETFEMSDNNCMEILVNLSRLSVKHFTQDSTTRSLYFDILVFALNRLTVLRKLTSDNQVVAKIGQIYADLISELKTEINLEKLEDAFCNFLTISHHCIEFIPKEIFLVVFSSRKITKSTVKFAVLLLERREDLTEVFLSNLSIHMSKKELIYPLLNVIFTRNIELDAKLLNSIYQEYKSGFIKTIEKPQKSGVIYKENANTSIYLIERCMPASECTDFCKKTLKTDAVEVFQLQIIEAIYQKAIQFNAANVEIQKTIFVNFINTALQLFSVVVKREPLENAKIAALSYSIYKWIKTYETNDETIYNFEKITGSGMWQNFCKTSLKLGMRSIEVDGQTVVGCDDASNAQFIKLLSYLCDKFYAPSCDHPDPAQLFEMAISHSRIIEIALSQNHSAVKTHLMQLLLTLVQKNKQVLDEKHIPILLGAYQAKLTSCDRYILALLQFYEQNAVNFRKYRPFIWGESAVDHYSLKEQEDKVTNLHQEPSIIQVMSLIDRQTSDNTVKNFPIWRRLNTLNQLPDIEFENPNSSVTFGKTELERKIESGESNFDEAFLKLCPTNPEVYEECYDPAFILPLMSMSFAPEVYSNSVRPVQNGLLGIVFAALSSQDKEMRLAAGCVHLRYRQHFENNKFLDKPLWMQAYDNIQNGLEVLQGHWIEHKKTGVPRVPYIAGLFLSKAMTTLIDPLNPLYKVLSMYLRVKDTFNFLCIPEFNVLFQSPEIDHHNFRQFIVQVIRDGIKCSSDLFQLVTTSTFKALMGFYNSTMSSLDVNLRILSVINTCVRIPASVKLMVEYVGVITWLNSVIDRVEYFHFDTIEGIISIISNLWYAMKAKQETFRNFGQLELRIFYLLVKLTPHVSGRISLNNFTKFLNIMAKTANGNHKVVTATDLDRIISCARRHFDSQIWYIVSIKEFGSRCIDSDQAFCKNLKDQKYDDMSVLALLSLRKFVIEWVK